jgi:hypothetical protein
MRSGGISRSAPRDRSNGGVSIIATVTTTVPSLTIGTVMTSLCRKKLMSKEID